MGGLSFVGAQARFRAGLLGSAAIASLAIGGVAHAEGVDGDSATAAPVISSTGAGGGDSAGMIDIAGAVLEAQSNTTIDGKIDVSVIKPEPEILITAPNTPTTARDPNNISGIGQIVVDNGGGSVGLCTATLINARTVLFAAHCVNNRAATAYGANSGGTAIGIGFETNTRANAAGQTDELVRWLFGGTGGAGRYQTNTAQAFYNIQQVVYNPLSTQPNANGFLYGDIALGVLDTPAANIPTWALLFSPLPAPGTIGAAGTGYHVTLTGYGSNGTGTSGALAIDFRRRAAENILGGLLSLGDFEQFLFGPSGTSNATNPQNLYWIDFDDPRRGTASASPFDFNAFRDNALPNEGITSGGDSGGPLILDRTYARQVVIGVLSGGYTRFFNGQPSNGYGTAAFYQPIYLYWDYIAANNPYRYVSALAGDGNWTDPTHWVTNVDPNYFIIGPNNTLVNGVPTNPGGTVIDTSGKFGQICFQNTSLSDCLDVRTGIETVTSSPIGTAGNNLGVASIDEASGPQRGGLQDGGLTEQVVGQAEAQDSGGTQNSAALPPATIANGLPGATNFVPNNSAGNRATGVLGRYFDVTLGAAGTTTLSSAVTIDRFTLNGLNARLDITSSGSLTSLIDVSHMLGTLQVNGSLTSVGDYMLLVGGVNGIGTISAPFFTSVAGVISPGASGNTGSIGTLTFRGNVILSSGNTYLLDLGANRTSDRIDVNATTFGANNVPTNGLANLGGNLALSFQAATFRAGNSYTILTSQGGITGTFQAPSAVSAILTPRLTYTANAVQLTVDAGSYVNVVQSSSPVQLAYARLLDQNRTNAGSLDRIYGPLDLQSAATIRATLDSLAPRTESLLTGLGIAAIDNLSRFYRDHLLGLSTENGPGGTVAVIGRPIELAAVASSTGLDGVSPVASDAGDGYVREGQLAEEFGAYLAGGYVDGSSRPQTGAVPLGGRDQLDGWYIAGGLDYQPADKLVVGASFAYSDLRGRTTVVGQSARAQLYQGSLYGKVEVGKGFTLDGQLNAGLLETDTTRNISFVGTNYVLRAGDSALTVGAEAGLSQQLPLGPIDLTPRASIRWSYIDFSDTAETGGGPALRYERNAYQSVQGRLGLTATGRGKLRPFVTGNYVREVTVSRRDFVAANFVGGSGPNQRFALFGVDRNWGEVGGGLSYAGEKVDLSIGADTTIGRDDVQNQSYHASVKIKF